MNRIRSEDVVMVISGKCKGMTGKVLKVIKNSRVLIENVNLVKKHKKPNPNTNEKGGVIEQPASLHISNVAMVNPVTNKVGKVGFKIIKNEDGTSKKVRYFKSNNELVDLV